MTPTAFFISDYVSIHTLFMMNRPKGRKTPAWIVARKYLPLGTDIYLQNATQLINILSLLATEYPKLKLKRPSISWISP